MRVLITGYHGFIGSSITQQLIEKGWDVVGLSRSKYACSNLSQHVLADVSSSSFVDDTERAVKPCDAIVHAAFSLDKRLFAPSVSLTNCLGVQHMITLAQRWDVKASVFLSGVLVIGKPEELPIDENHPIHPPTAFHASQIYGEHLAALARRIGMTIATLRLTSPVGPGMPSGRIFSTFVKRALENKPLELLGQGTRRQDYVHVMDVAKAVELCLRQKAEGVFNIGSGQCISNIDLANLCIEILHSSSKIIHTDKEDAQEGIRWDVSIRKASENLGYHPKFTCADSIRNLANYYVTGNG